MFVELRAASWSDSNIRLLLSWHFRECSNRGPPANTGFWRALDLMLANSRLGQQWGKRRIRPTCGDPFTPLIHVCDLKSRNGLAYLFSGDMTATRFMA